MSSTPGPHTIEIRVRDVHQLFNSLDPSPFHDRDLDRDAAQYIREELEDVPADREVRLVIWIPASQLDRAARPATFIGRRARTARMGYRAFRPVFRRRAPLPRTTRPLRGRR